MKYPKIIAELERAQWAITPEALYGIFKAVDKGLDDGDYELFHKAVSSEMTETTKKSSVNGRGVLVINGPIIPRGNALTESSGIVAIDKLTKDFKALEADEAIKEIVLLIDSPGGTVTGVSDFAKLIKVSETPTAAFVVGQAASAAYWIASATDRIVSTDTGQVGSIGVVSTYRASTKEGEREFISAQSPYKRPDLDSKEGKAVMQDLVNEIADVFIGTVAKNRDASVETVLNKFGKGGLVVAKKALEVGMIDEISTVNDFMLEAKCGGRRFESSNQLEKTELTKPAIAGERTAAMITLADFLAENPAAKAELEAIRAEAFEAGKTAGMIALRTRHEKVARYLQGDAYPIEVKNLAIEVIKGNSEFAALEGAAVVMDAMRQKMESVAAQQESAEQPESQDLAAPQTQSESQDGQLRTVADVEAWQARMRLGNGEVEVV